MVLCCDNPFLFYLGRRVLGPNFESYEYEVKCVRDDCHIDSRYNGRTRLLILKYFETHNGVDPDIP